MHLKVSHGGGFKLLFASVGAEFVILECTLDNTDIPCGRSWISCRPRCLDCRTSPRECCNPPKAISLAERSSSMLCVVSTSWSQKVALHQLLVQRKTFRVNLSTTFLFASLGFRNFRLSSSPSPPSWTSAPLLGSSDVARDHLRHHVGEFVNCRSVGGPVGCRQPRHVQAHGCLSIGDERVVCSLANIRGAAADEERNPANME
jgi:hypothetical protein